ncbi:hypothetical protein [Thiocapsa sp.]|uniref:hypothetical protein n=1 Tax=Thiocapsa sp. TaxID=2024551 RepID=UPI0025F2EC0A|nr:hypothetical protein [Thiocapsa sp.]
MQTLGVASIVGPPSVPWLGAVFLGSPVPAGLFLLWESPTHRRAPLGARIEPGRPSITAPPADGSEDVDVLSNVYHGEGGDLDADCRVAYGFAG